MQTDVEINKRELDNYKHYLENKDKPLFERHKRTDIREGYAKRYPELADDNYVQSMQDVLPAVELTAQQKRQIALEQSLVGPLSTNTNVQIDRPESLLTDRQELESLLNDR